MGDENLAAREPSEKDLNFKKTTREVRVEQSVQTAELTIDRDEGSQALSEYVRRKFNLSRDFEVRVTICDTERTDDLCLVTVTKVAD
ncbi:hypothetical protein G6M86_03625 [Agrobacterium tumefaciens]|uniref:Uncharacterized protein n=1 Tax=Agrobacterium tumefaciens TaxID=358 RepID=A0AAJ4N015_AGRTU|nr:hypothetical protein G6M86_03625 [Agrobacterium tumefaciens]